MVPAHLEEICMGYGDGGRYHNVGLSRRDLLPATRKQLATLYRLTRRDHSAIGLNRGQASERIDQAIAAKEEKKVRRNAGGFERLYEVVLRQAAQAATDAGRDWLARHPKKLFDVAEADTLTPCHGVVGTAFLRKPPKSNPFMQWFAEQHPEAKGDVLVIDHQFRDRWERDLHVACQAAAMKILKRQGVQGLRLFVREEPGENSRIQV
ncbi:hypothetical protein [Methylorubrum extorquens]|jgi:hypothetical protein|uniref:Uncharacterized protein n=1 Tax=Methylorubrum extorquens DSM 13060 TaxID=882800 RepID=H1KUE3_METEX|nr:hypothetical protein [Methylorubrum extorquens]EHP82716.1 hypothetical protein MetexDRAFT_6256 [Methylorubrum extorquens DSM 13060]